MKSWSNSRERQINKELPLFIESKLLAHTGYGIKIFKDTIEQGLQHPQKRSSKIRQ